MFPHHLIFRADTYIICIQISNVRCISMEEKRNRDGKTLGEFLREYDPNKYRRPSVAADIAVFTPVETDGALALGVLLIKRGDHPHIGEYALPGGFVNMDEEIISAAARELMEETGVTGVPLREYHTYSAVDRDPRTRIITAAHYAVLPFGEGSIAAGDDAAYTEVFEVDTRLMARCASAETYQIALYGVNDMLTCRCKLRYDELGSYTEPIPGGGLASDHGHVLFGALMALRRQPADRLARLMTRACPQRELEMLIAIDSALSALPQRCEI